MYGRRQSRSPQRANRRERCSPERTQRNASASTFGPSFASNYSLENFEQQRYGVLAHIKGKF